MRHAAPSPTRIATAPALICLMTGINPDHGSQEHRSARRPSDPCCTDASASIRAHIRRSKRHAQDERWQNARLSDLRPELRAGA